VPFYFAWCGPGESFSSAHIREDEAVLSFDITHTEGQIPTLDIELKNPHVGLLAPGRLQWVWFSWKSPNDGSVTPLFYGRLIALPSNLLGEVVTLKFLARPVNYLAQKQAVAETMKVSPYYDPIWIVQDKLDDADTILETYTSSWHVDRFAQTVSVSDITFGEDGTEEFQFEDSYYDSVAISFSQAPQNQVIFDGTINWTQQETGVVAVPATSIAAVNAAQVAADWPSPGDQLGNGVSVASSSISIGGGGSVTEDAPQNVSIQIKNFEKTHEDGDLLSYNLSISGYLSGTIVSQNGSSVSGDPETGQAGEGFYNATYAGIKDVPSSGGNNVQGNMDLAYEMQRGRTETLKFVVASQLQSIITVPDDEPFNPIKISMQGTDVSLALAGGPPPIGYSGRSTFLPTDRGLQSMIYPMLIARAHLMMSARAVKVSFDCTFERALNLSCRKNALLHDPRLPGGQIIGKITDYHMKGAGDTGTLIGTIQLESTIGTGDHIFVSEGTPTYVDDGYVSVGYQFYTNADLTLPTDDLTIEIPASFNVDDGLVTPLTYSQLVTKFEIHHGAQVNDIVASQPFTPDFSTEPDTSSTGVVGAAGSAADQYQVTTDASVAIWQAYDNAIRYNPTWLEINIAPVAGQTYHAEYDLGVAFLTVPKLVDLEAANA
jgi:hypothetical protein